VQGHCGFQESKLGFQTALERKKKKKDVARGEKVGEEGPRHDGRSSEESTATRRLPRQETRRSAAIHSARRLPLPNLPRRRSLPSHTGSAGPVCFFHSILSVP